MRLAICALSAVLLSGCSWLGGLGGGNHQGHQAKSANYEYGGAYSSKRQKRAHNYGRQHNPCQISSPQQPIPRGCDPASVTLATPHQAYGNGAYGSFPQEPNFGAGYGSQHGGQYASHGYGSHAGVAQQQAAHYQPRKQLRKPRWRGAFSMGIEKSTSGSLLDYSKFPGVNPELLYNPADYNEGFTTGSPQSGAVVDTLYTAIVEDISKPDISFDDAHSTPLNFKGGIEYILTPRTTIFANAGYAYSEGEDGRAVSVTGELQRRITTENYVTIPAVPGVPAVPSTPAIPPIPPIPPSPAFPGGFPGTPGIPGTPGSPAIPGIPESYVLDNIVTDVGFIPNENIANYHYDFTDMERLDFEIGARHYFNPIIKDQGFKTLTPFVAASIGAAHYNAVSFNVTQDQRYYERAYESDGETQDYYQVVPPNLVPGTERVDLYDSQWRAKGELTAGMEWQLTPKTALAFETGVRIEQAREYSNGVKGDKNIAIPLTLRGSYNF